jgi:hypothetical protein
VHVAVCCTAAWKWQFCSWRDISTSAAWWGLFCDWWDVPTLACLLTHTHARARARTHSRIHFLVKQELLLTLMNLLKQTRLSNSVLLWLKIECKSSRITLATWSKLVRSEVFGLNVIICLNERWDLYL